MQVPRVWALHEAASARLHRRHLQSPKHSNDPTMSRTLRTRWRRKKSRLSRSTRQSSRPCRPRLLPSGCCLKLQNIIILQNKVDLIKEAQALGHQKSITAFVKGAFASIEKESLTHSGGMELFTRDCCRRGGQDPPEGPRGAERVRSSLDAADRSTYCTRLLIDGSGQSIVNALCTFSRILSTILFMFVLARATRTLACATSITSS
ncbi:hypothetical protein DFH11DRAFT_355572 [Phellopilus nigrolimitatus]|nr:hypothetical protein DFH11DRAFT_355572 [Phellopilus nigrolimitatus]